MGQIYAQGLAGTPPRFPPQIEDGIDAYLLERVRAEAEQRDELPIGEEVAARRLVLEPGVGAVQ